MKRLLNMLFAATLVICLFVPCHAEEWTTYTPLGISIRLLTTQTIIQYEERWSQSWESVEWGRIDDLFLALAAAYEVTPDPYYWHIVISSWSPNCPDLPEGSKEMAVPDIGCCEGVYSPSGPHHTIWIHLGDDSGSGPNSWCATALDHEMDHGMLRLKGDQCWFREYNPLCYSHYLSGFQVGFCN